LTVGDLRKHVRITYSEGERGVEGNVPVGLPSLKALKTETGNQKKRKRR